jgi:hypothetical protein
MIQTIWQSLDSCQREEVAKTGAEGCVLVNSSDRSLDAYTQYQSGAHDARGDHEW